MLLEAYGWQELSENDNHLFSLMIDEEHVIISIDFQYGGPHSPLLGMFMACTVGYISEETGGRDAEKEEQGGFLHGTWLLD